MKKITYLLASIALLTVGFFSFITPTSAQTLPAGCTSSSGYSTTTGAPCSSTSGVYTVYTRDLTIGSVGADVVSLQTFLETKGFLNMPAGEAKGYFGNLTKSALAAYQASKGISPADGFFGPVTRAVVNADQGSTTTFPLTVLSPNGGETYKIGDSMPISWKATYTDSVYLSLYQDRDGDGTYENNYALFSNTPQPSTGSTTLTVPSTIFGRSSVSSRNKIRASTSINPANNTSSDFSDSPFSIVDATSASITVLSPNGGEVLQAGTTTRVTIFSAVPGLQYSVTVFNNGVGGIYYSYTDQAVVYEEANANNLLIKIPDDAPIGNGYKVKVSYKGENGTISDESDGTFRIGSNSGNVMITNPNKDSIWESGKTYTINWTRKYNPPSYTSLTLRNRDTLYSFPIANSLKENISSYPITLDNSLMVPGSNYIVSIDSYDKAFLFAHDDSDKFTITSSTPTTTPSIKVLSPNGGEKFVAGQSIRLRWTPGLPGITYLALQGPFAGVSSGETTYINPSVTPDTSGSIDYTLPSTLSPGQYQVSVVRGVTTGSVINFTTLDVSDGMFTINSPTASPTITVLSPNGGEVYKPGETMKISWSTNNFQSNKIKIDLSYTYNGQNTYFPVSLGAPDNGEYSWTIPEWLKDSPKDLKIKITAIGKEADIGKSIEDLSDNYFTITSSVSTTPDAEVKMVGRPMLRLTYDTKKNESALTGTFRVNVKAGKQDVHFIKDSFWVTTKDTKSDRTADNINEAKNTATYPGLRPYTDQYGRTVYVLPAGRTVAMTLTKTLNPQYMYAGAYTETLKEIYTLDPKEPGNNITLQVPTNTSNTVTIVGEKAVSPTPVPTLSVFNPNRAGVYKAGAVLNVQWKSTNIPATTSINIDLVDSNGTPTRLASAVKNTGIKATIIPTTMVAGSYRILISTNDAGASASDYSDEYFTITAATTLVAPTTNYVPPTTTITPDPVAPVINQSPSATTTTTTNTDTVTPQTLGEISIVSIPTTKIFKSGNSINLQWKTVSGTAPATVSIDLVDSSGNNFALKTNIKNSNYTTVTIPAGVSNGAYRVRVYGSTAEGYSNAIKIENLTTTGASAAGATPSLWSKLKSFLK